MTHPQPAPSSVCFECIIPILRVECLPRSLAYYIQTLGFQVDWGGEAGSNMASVSRDGCSIMLCEGDQGQPGAWVWIGVEDAAAIHAEYLARGAAVRLPPTNYYWAYEFRIEDPDGHMLRFGSEPKTDEPFAA